MTCRLPALFAFLASVGLAAGADAQSLVRTGAGPASTPSGRVHGTVTDEGGRTVGEVSIVALGATLIAAKSDLLGRFSLLLPPGQYILRAVREGYVSTLREPIDVGVDAPVEKNITLIQYTGAADQPAGGGPATLESEDHSHSERAWRLRRLPRTVLRDVAAAGIVDGPRDMDWARSIPEAAVAFFSGTDFTGQVNLLTTGSWSATNRSPAERRPHGVAHVSVGAPVGSHGDWSIRASMAPGATQAWTFNGDYTARAERPHAVRFGVSHSGQRPSPEDRSPVRPGTPNSRTVGGVYASDRWQIVPSLAVEYGARFDRYDYLAEPNLFSPRGGLRVAVLPRTFVAASAAKRVNAPGADEFLPVSASGTWLPPERTFSPLGANGSLRPERIHHYDFTVEHEIGAERAATISIRRFSQSTEHQLSVLFGLDASSEIGHYYVATPGNVDVVGWTVELAGRLTPVIRGRIAYTRATADWQGPRNRYLSYKIPSAARSGAEDLHDVTSAIEMSIPETATHVAIAYRISSAFATTSRTDAEASTGGRFKVEIRQALPYQPLRNGKLNFVLTVRTLRHEDPNAGSFYDELLTVGPPTRLTGGLQVWF